MARYVIRGATRDDEDGLLELAKLLNTVNLPADRAHIRSLLAETEASFAGNVREIGDARFIFILRDLETGDAAGTSMILAQLGTRDAPYIYLDVFAEEKYSRALDRYFHHTVMRLGFSYDGPTEIGGLIVNPRYRRAPERLGLLISYVRFLFIAAHRDRFRGQVLAELLPPLASDGTSPLWEALGRRFTNMTYREADFLSSQDKDFIKDLFPHGSIYASLLSDEAQAAIGEVGAQTKGVEKMLRRVGFRYTNRVDPFDGGPHFAADTHEISLIEHTEHSKARRLVRPADARFLVGHDLEGPPYFVALACRGRHDAEHVALPADAMETLGLAEGDAVWCLPLRG